MVKKKKTNILETGQFRTIKLPLKSILRNPSRDLPILNNYAFQINKTVIIAYQLVRLFIIDRYQKKLPLPVVDEQLYERALIIATGSVKKLKETTHTQDFRQQLTDFFVSDFKHLIVNDNLPKVTNISVVIQKLREEMEVSFKNNLGMHYYKRLSKTIAAILESNSDFIAIANKVVPDEDAAAVKKRKNELKMIHSSILKAVLDHDSTAVKPVIFKELAEFVIKNFVPDKWTKSLAYDLVREPEKFLLPTLNMQAYLEKANKKSFQSVPLRESSIPAHFPIDSKTLKYLMDFKGLVKYKNELDNFATDTKIERKMWNHYFKLDKNVFISNTHEFFYSIHTDGFSCSLKFIKKGTAYDKFSTQKKSEKLAWSPPKITDLDQETRNELLKHSLVGGDPGKWNIIQFVDQNGASLRYRTPQRKHESGHQKNQKIREKLMTAAKIKEFELPLNQLSTQTVSVERFKEYIKARAKVNLQVEGHYNQIIYRKLNFRNQIKGKASIKKFINRTKKKFGVDASLLYGNWSISEQMKHCVPTPGIYIKKELARAFGMYDIDEYGSSKYSMCCNQELKYHYVNGVKLYRVLVCCGCKKECSGPQDVKKIRFINRDINGATNILKLGLCELNGVEKPAVYKRKVKPVTEPETNNLTSGTSENNLVATDISLYKNGPDENVIPQEMVCSLKGC